MKGVGIAGQCDCAQDSWKQEGGSRFPNWAREMVQEGTGIGFQSKRKSRGNQGHNRGDEQAFSFGNLQEILSNSTGCSVYGRTILAGQSKPRWPMLDTTERFLVIASCEKGQDFLRQCAEMGVKPTLLTL